MRIEILCPQLRILIIYSSERKAHPNTVDLIGQKAKMGPVQPSVFTQTGFGPGPIIEKPGPTLAAKHKNPGPPGPSSRMIMRERVTRIGATSISLR